MSHDGEGCAWSLFQGEVQVLDALRPRCLDIPEYVSWRQIGTQVWSLGKRRGLGWAPGELDMPETVGRTACFHVTLKPTSCSLRSSSELLIPMFPVEETLDFTLEGDIFLLGVCSRASQGCGDMHSKALRVAESLGHTQTGQCCSHPSLWEQKPGDPDVGLWNLESSCLTPDPISFCCTGW